MIQLLVSLVIVSLSDLNFYSLCVARVFPLTLTQHILTHDVIDFYCNHAMVAMNGIRCLSCISPIVYPPNTKKVC
jgi:hypothetical protein